MTHLIRTLAAALLLVAGAAQAQTMKPGLWELSHRMQSASGQLEQAMAQAQQQMANLPPEQRKMVQEMMAKQGLSPGMGGGATSVRMCLTKEMVERNELPAQQQGDCKTTHAPRSGNTMKMSFTCTNPPSTGEGQVTFTSADAYSMKMATTTVLQGKPEKINMDGTGRWLGADCGAVKPMGVPPSR